MIVLIFLVNFLICNYLTDAKDHETCFQLVIVHSVAPTQRHVIVSLILLVKDFPCQRVY